MSSSSTNQNFARAGRLVIRLWALLALTPASRAATVLTDGYALRLWQTDDGLPQNAVSSAVQTRDGYLWIGTFGGLARFDGEKFEVFDAATTPELQDSRIVSLFEDANGTLWIGHESGVVSRYRAGRFESLALAPGAKRQNIRALGSDATGRIWVLHYDGTLESPTNGAHVPTLIPHYEPTVIAWSRGTDGEIWVVENGVVAQLRAGHFVPLTLDPAHSTYAVGVAAAAGGGGVDRVDRPPRKMERPRRISGPRAGAVGKRNRFMLP